MRSYEQIEAQYEALIGRKNEIDTRYENGVYDRWVNPVLTRAHVPPFWCYDPNPETNPFMMQRLGINAAFNSGAILLDGRFTLVARVEGADRKNFFAVAQSDSGVEGFRFWDKPVELPDTCPEETNVYDMRLTQHEDGWIYGVFCSESKDTGTNDLSAAVAAAGIVRTKDLKTWERLPNLRTLHSPQQRNVVLHPELVDGKYAFYTRPMDGFIETGSGGGPALCDLRLCDGAGRSRARDRGAGRLPHRPDGRRARGRRGQRGLHQRRNRRAGRAGLHLLRLQRHAPACGDDHG